MSSAAKAKLAADAAIAGRSAVGPHAAFFANFLPTDWTAADRGAAGGRAQVVNTTIRQAAPHPHATAPIRGRRGQDRCGPVLERGADLLDAPQRSPTSHAAQTELRARLSEPRGATLKPPVSTGTAGRLRRRGRWAT
jgi:hypothetical protein